MIVPLAHVVGIPVEETIPYMVPVAGLWLFAGKHWIHYYRNRMQSTNSEDGEIGSSDEDR